MPILYAMCGLAFAGKSTAARRIAAATGAALVSLDAIHAERGLDPGADIAVDTWEETGRQALERVRRLLDQGRSVVVDDTFSYRFQRDRFRQAAEARGAGFLVLFLDPPDEVLEARVEENRRRPTRPHVSPAVIDHIRREFQPPDGDEPTIRFTGPEAVEDWLRGA